MPPDAKPNLYVVARFLDHLAERSHTRSTLQAAAGVNYDILRRYLEFLERKGFVRVQARARAEGSATVELTAEGRRVRAELLAWIALFLEPSAILPAPPAPQPAPDGQPT